MQSLKMIGERGISQIIWKNFDRACAECIPSKKQSASHFLGLYFLLGPLLNPTLAFGYHHFKVKERVHKWVELRVLEN